jgi:hypothetical protein
MVTKRADRKTPGGRTHALGGKLLDVGKERREKLQLMINSRPRSLRNDLLPTMELQTLAIKDLKMPKRMVRKLDEGHIKEVANGIQGMGFSVPVLVGKNNVTIDGASSVKAAEGLGLTEVPCVLLSHLSDDEQRVLRITIKPGQPKGGVGFGRRSNSRS